MQTPQHPLRVALTAAALLLVAGCNSKPETITAGPKDDMANQLAKAPPVELPPALVASKSYRCKDNSVVYIDWLQGDKQANLRKKREDLPTVLKSDTPGKDLKADGGYVLDGTADAKEVTLTMPGKDKQSCNV